MLALVQMFNGYKDQVEPVPFTRLNNFSLITGVEVLETTTPIVHLGTEVIGIATMVLGLFVLVAGTTLFSYSQIVSHSSTPRLCPVLYRSICTHERAVSCCSRNYCWSSIRVGSVCGVGI